MNAAIEVLRDAGRRRADDSRARASARHLRERSAPGRLLDRPAVWTETRPERVSRRPHRARRCSSLTEIIAFNSTSRPADEVRSGDLRGGRHARHRRPAAPDTLRYLADLRGRSRVARRAGRVYNGPTACGTRTSSTRSSPRRTASPARPRRRATRASPCLAGSCRPTAPIVNPFPSGRDLLGSGVLGAAPDRPRVCVRAGDPPPPCRPRARRRCPAIPSAAVTDSEVADPPQHAGGSPRLRPRYRSPGPPSDALRTRCPTCRRGPSKSDG